MPLQPFTNYSIEIDLESEEVIVEAWDDEAPMDTFRGRFSLEDGVGRMLTKLTSALRRT